jgi:uncharacterized protein YndB with AHSA1/START domain
MMSAMRFTHELSYDAPPDAVFEMLADPEFRQRACAAMEVVSADVQLEREGDGFTLVIDQQQNTKDIPAFARTIIGESTHVVQREVWPSTSTGSLAIETPGKPISTRGTIRLVPNGAGTTERVELEIKVKLPLIGGRLEKLMADKVAEGMDLERTVGVAWLEER